MIWTSWFCLINKAIWKRSSSFRFNMIKRTMSLFTIFSKFALHSLVWFRMINILISMCIWTIIDIVTGIILRSNFKLLTLKHRIKLKKLRFSSKILPIMSKDTIIKFWLSLMIIFWIRTPNSFEMKHVEIRVFLHIF